MLLTNCFTFIHRSELPTDPLHILIKLSLPSIISGLLRLELPIPPPLPLYLSLPPLLLRFAAFAFFAVLFWRVKNSWQFVILYPDCHIIFA